VPFDFAQGMVSGAKRNRTMKSHTDYLMMNTPQRKELVNITDEIAEAVDKSGIREGMILVSAMHITAGIFVNDEESGLKRDIMKLLEHLAPVGDYEHHKTGEDNGDAHLKRMLVNHQVILPITQGKLDLGPWEQVFYAEFDGQRKKKVILKAIGE
jgi:secondary thiamine-phosphate synthase enzyme